MGKRKHQKDSYSRSKKKRKHKKRSRHEFESSSSGSESDKEVDKYHEYDYGYHDQYNENNYQECYDTPSYSPLYDLPSHDSDDSMNEHQLQSVVSKNQLTDTPTMEPNIVEKDTSQPSREAVVPDVSEPGKSTSTPTQPSTRQPLTKEELEAIGDPKGKEEVFGPQIPKEIAKRWGRVLVDGLTKEKKQEIIEKSLIPDNFRLAKAPLLNSEIFTVLSPRARGRDKLLEKSQNQLGLGIAKLSNLATSIIEGNIDKIDLLKEVSETSQIFLDLHNMDTKRRRRLVTSSLDKKFLYMVNDVKRDTHLFGVNLGEKIKATQSAERSGLQIKRKDPKASTSKNDTQSGNWRGPPRGQGQRGYRQGGQRSRYWSQQNRGRGGRQQQRAPPKQRPSTPKPQ